MKLSILIPFRDADGTRTPGHEWMLRRWRHFYPDAEFIVAPDDGVDPFNKPMAVNNAAAQATGDIYVILDADTWIEPAWLERSVKEIAYGRWKWAAPSRHMRLKQHVSDRLLALDPTEPLPPLHPTRDTDSFGPVVGFLWVVLASAWWDMAWHNEQGQPRGMDERIRGWGGEDSMFRMAAQSIIGPPRRLGGTVVCLWHERPRNQFGRYWKGQDRSTEKWKEELAQQYRSAIRRRPAMRQLLGQP